MAFDATPSILDFDPKALTDPAERLDYLIAFLRHLPDRKFHMNYWRADVADADATVTAQELVHNCGTVACIGGWAEALFFDSDATPAGEDLAEAIGCDDDFGLFYGQGRDLDTLTKAQAIRVLEHLQATGEVDWGIVE